jgi:hypothetical protein
MSDNVILKYVLIATFILVVCSFGLLFMAQAL